MQKYFFFILFTMPTVLSMHYNKLQLKFLKNGGFVLVNPSLTPQSVNAYSKLTVMASSALTQACPTSASCPSDQIKKVKTPLYLGGACIPYDYFEYPGITISSNSKKGAVIVDVSEQEHTFPCVGKPRCVVLTKSNIVKILTNKEYREWEILGEGYKCIFFYKVQNNNEILFGLSGDKQYALIGCIKSEHGILNSQLVIKLCSVNRVSEQEKIYIIDWLMLPVDDICCVFNAGNTWFAIKTRLDGSNKPEQDEYWFVYDVNSLRALCLVYTNKLIYFKSNRKVIDSNGVSHTIVKNWA